MEGNAVETKSKAALGWLFVNWTGNVDLIADVNATTTNITIDGYYYITAKFRWFNITIA